MTRIKYVEQNQHDQKRNGVEIPEARDDKEKALEDKHLFTAEKISETAKMYQVEKRQQSQRWSGRVLFESLL